LPFCITKVYEVATPRKRPSTKGRSSKEVPAEVTQDAVAGRFKQARTSLGLTQADVVRETGRTKDYVSKVERGVLGLSLPMLCYLHSKGINLNWLITGQGEERIALIKGKGSVSAKDIDEAFKVLRKAVGTARL
jgi:transcriptional regulator with XRE-family HTH domain